MSWASETTVAPQGSLSGPKAAAYGARQGFPVGDAHTWNELPYLVGSYSHFDAIFPARGIPHPADVWNFRRDPVGSRISYRFEGRTNSLDDYLSQIPVTGLLIGKNDEILAERYQYGRTDRDRFTSASMAKSIVAMLLGVASADHPRFSTSRRAEEFVPGLRHTAYGETTIRDLLHMSSGVVANDGLLIHKLYAKRRASDEAVLAAFYQRPSRPGAHFHYSCGDSETLGLVLHDVVGEALATYLSEKVWRPIGAEEDGSWSVDTYGEELTCFGLNATLRDWGRLARLLASDGNWNGKQIIPRKWLLDATTIHPTDTQLEPGVASERFGYGYQLWILPGARRMFALIGADGQFIMVDPASKLYMVQTAVTTPPADPKTAEAMALWQSLVENLGN
ncbi:MAG: serine hydrolase domain-containing protein [Bryobacteraceae bacterium]